MCRVKPSACEWCAATPHTRQRLQNQPGPPQRCLSPLFALLFARFSAPQLVVHYRCSVATYGALPLAFSCNLISSPSLPSPAAFSLHIYKPAGRQWPTTFKNHYRTEFKFFILCKPHCCQEAAQAMYPQAMHLQQLQICRSDSRPTAGKQLLPKNPHCVTFGRHISDASASAIWGLDGYCQFASDINQLAALSQCSHTPLKLLSAPVASSCAWKRARQRPDRHA